jgi:hypothetical protein
MKLIYQHDKLASAILEGDDIPAVTYALRAALQYAPHADLKPDLERVLGELTAPAPETRR